MRDAPPAAFVPLPSVPVFGVFAWYCQQNLVKAPPPEYIAQLSAADRAEIRAGLAGLALASEAFLQHWAVERKLRARSDGSAEAIAAEMGSGFGDDDLIDTTEAAAMLGVSESRVRQRARAGELGADKPRGRWLVSRAAVQVEAERRVAA